MTENRHGHSYADPYFSGIGLGLILLACFVILGRGLGVSGGFVSAARTIATAANPLRATASPVFARYPGDFLGEWAVYEIAGMMIGGYLSARLAGRLRLEVERGQNATRSGRLLAAFSGGLAMGGGAVLARGCTSGLALTGGALLSVGSWVFMMAAFAAGYAVTPLFRKAWR